MQLSCASCGAKIPAADVSLERLVAKCRQCDAVFSFAANVGRAASPPQARPPLPPGIRIEKGEPPLPDSPTYRSVGRPHDPGPLVITRRWFQFHHLFLLFFCIAWDSFLVFWYTVGAASGGPWIMFVFPLAHVAVGVGLTYSTVAGLLNRTTIRVADGVLEVKHGPIPWRGNLRVPVAALRQLYLRTTTHRGKNGVSHTWDVRAETEDQASIALVSKLPRRDQAEYIEWAIEQHLGIEDQPGYDESV
jgi:hypothetical protein